MTQEEKQLLLADLCARLPYGVKVKTPYNDAILRGIVDRKGVKTTIDYTDIVTDKQTYPIRYIKPYLRPMSSMAEEECDMVEEILGDKCIFDFMSNGDIVLKQGQFSQNKLAKLYDYYTSIHVDYRGLIPKGLALEAPDGIYNIKEHNKI